MYTVGDSVPLSFLVVNAQQTLVDATVVLTVDQPDGTPATPAVVQGDVGRYSAVFVPTQPGRHVVRWAATGAYAAAQVDVLNVAAAADSVALISLLEAKEHLNMDLERRDDDDELRGFITAASRVVERYTKQVIARRTVVEDGTPDRTGMVVLQTAPILSVTSATSLDGATTYTATVLDAANGIVSVPAWETVRFTLVAGYGQVPEDTIKATQIICAHLWETQRVQAVGPGPIPVGELSAPEIGRGYLIPNQAAQLLGGRAPNRP
jgi:uncharacterized phiE125 gp8 family phage protein